MKIKVTSDTHGYLPSNIGSFDLLLICGDICPAHDHYYDFQSEWVLNEFTEWVNKLSFNDDKSKIVLIPGNHDFCFQVFDRFKDELYKRTNGRLVVLINEAYEHEGLSIFGTPYCKIFFNWAFMLPDDKLREKYSEIPYNCDILMCHDAPDIKGLGMINEGYHMGTNAGNVVLAEAVREKKPKYVFCGHIHSGNHDMFEYEGMKMANVSYIDESYKPMYNILEFDY